MKWKSAVGVTLVLSGAAAFGSVSQVQFVDITTKSGIQFTHNNGAAGNKYLPETLGAGGAFLDYNNDGLQDILLVNGKDWGASPARKTTSRLYKNNGNRSFTDVTAKSGLDGSMYGMGVAAADYDNDGNIDVYITALEGDRLFRNIGDGTFKDVTAAAGISNASFGTSAAWVDYDNDGKLDLFVANYVQWSPQSDIRCSLDGRTKSYCTPESYKGTASKLYRNKGNGGFEDATRAAGVYDAGSKSLGVTVVDIDVDGWPDLLVANDTQPNKLYRNLKNGAFREEGVRSGVAYSAEGVVRGAMGIDWSDYDQSGLPSVAIGNFTGQMLGLYHNEGNALFVDEAPRSSVGRASLLSLAFGLFFFDFDLDGRPDLFVANGHIDDQIEKIQPRVKYRQPPHLFHNDGDHRFDDVVTQVGPALQRAVVGRGAAYGDIDNDGALDILLTTNGGPAYLFRNQNTTGNHALKVRTAGSKGNRDGIGARVRLHTTAGWQWQVVKTGSSYCSQSELPLTFGLGAAGSADVVEVYWPNGGKEVFSNVAGDQIITLKEGSGIAGLRPLADRRQ
jgi:enediyne biosynthesis protein E4